MSIDNLADDIPANWSFDVCMYETVIPFTSPDAVKPKFVFIPKGLPVTSVLSSVVYVNNVAPLTVISAAFAETAARDPAKAVNPTFLKLFIIFSFSF